MEEKLVQRGRIVQDGKIMRDGKLVPGGKPMTGVRPVRVWKAAIRKISCEEEGVCEV